MKTILYRIPDKCFPGVKILSPFHAKVNYDIKDGQLQIYDVALSPKCLEYVDARSLRNQLQKDLEKAEVKRIENLHPVMAEALAPFTKSITR